MNRGESSGKVRVVGEFAPIVQTRCDVGEHFNGTLDEVDVTADVNARTVEVAEQGPVVRRP